jgi:hypothetical protein
MRRIGAGEDGMAVIFSSCENISPHTKQHRKMAGHFTQTPCRAV